MRPDHSYILTPEKNRKIFITRIIPTYFINAAHMKAPQLHVVGAQPGSGKTTIIRKITDDLKNRFGEYAVVSIVGDKFRAFHPHHQELLEIDASRAAFYTDADSGRWVEQAIALTAQQGNCVVIEGTLRNPETTIRTASQYLNHDYSAHLHVLAVHEFESRLRIFQRYFDQVERKGLGRYTLPEAHDRSYKVLPESIAAIMDSSLFKTVMLYDQEQTTIHDVNLPEKDACRNILAVLEKCRENKNVNMKWMLMEIDNLIPKAKEHGGVYNDLLELREKVSTCCEKANE